MVRLGTRLCAGEMLPGGSIARIGTNGYETESRHGKPGGTEVRRLRGTVVGKRGSLLLLAEKQPKPMSKLMFVEHVDHVIYNDQLIPRNLCKCWLTYV